MLALVALTGAGPAWAALAPAETDAFNGQTAPGFIVQTIDGSTIDLKNYRGHPVLLNFFASWCPPCREEITELMKLQQQYAPAGLVIVGVATDAKLIPETSKDQERHDVELLVKRLRIPYPVTIAQEELLRQYNFKGIPTIVFIHKDGQIVKVFYGYHTQEQLEPVVRKLFMGQ